MSALEAAFYASGIVAAAGALVGVGYGPAWVLKRLKVANTADAQNTIDAAIKPVTDELRGVSERLIRVEAQFGDNGNGLRQAVNDGNRETAAVRATVDGLVARFEDHLTQSADDRARLANVERAIRPRR